MLQKHPSTTVEKRRWQSISIVAMILLVAVAGLVILVVDTLPSAHRVATDLIDETVEVQDRGAKPTGRLLLEENSFEYYQRMVRKHRSTNLMDDYVLTDHDHEIVTIFLEDDKSSNNEGNFTTANNDNSDGLDNQVDIDERDKGTKSGKGGGGGSGGGSGSRKSGGGGSSNPFRRGSTSRRASNSTSTAFVLSRVS